MLDSMKTLLKEQYSINISAIEPQQGGWAALAYKATSESKHYFVKVYEKSRASTAKLTAHIDRYVPIIRWLVQNSQLEGKISVPLLTNDGCYKYEDEHGIYMLYDYIEGETIGDRELNGKQVHQFIAIITELHRFGAEIPFASGWMKEQFDVPYTDLLQKALSGDIGYMPDEVRRLLAAYELPLSRTINKVKELSQRLQAGELKMALCHTDLHYWNVMRQIKSEQLILIDWEGLKLAPVEADMMFLVDKPYFNEFLNVYRHTHADYEIHSEALLFYQKRRLLEDIWEFLEQLLYEEQGELTFNYLTKELKAL